MSAQITSQPEEGKVKINGELYLATAVML